MKNRTRVCGLAYAAVGLLGCLAASPAGAHHILGVPHYAYDENYPQTPVLTYRAEIHDYVVEMTGYPGKPEPGERFSLHAYVQNAGTGEVVSDGAVLTVKRDRFLVRDAIIYGPMEAELEESMYKYFPQFEVAGDYVLELAFETEGDDWLILLPMTVGEPKSPWAMIGIGLALGCTALIIARAVLIKSKRREERAASPDMTPSMESGETV